MKGVLPILAAGGSFGAASLVGMFAGILVAQRTGSQLWVFAGLLAGMAAGAYSAVRLLIRSQ